MKCKLTKAQRAEMLAGHAEVYRASEQMDARNKEIARRTADTLLANAGIPKPLGTSRRPSSR
jgi:uncharacterized tellurite resistance protein B-like protein